MKKITLAVLTIALSIGLIGFNRNDPTIRFLESLDDGQISELIMPFDDMSKKDWHYLPAKMWPRTGLKLGELNENQKIAFSQMLQSFLSE